MSQSDTTSPQPEAGAEGQRPWKPSLVLALILGVLYGLLQNGQWGPISDADVYVTVARNIVLGQGFTFNGLPVRVYPPGWPYVLAGLMQVSASFLFLNIVQAAMGLAWLLVFYRILLRLTTPRRSFIVCLVVGILSPVYHRAFLLHSEPLFCLMGAGAALLALQVAEGRRASWRLPLVVALAAGSVAVRWAGVMFCPVVIGALMTGRLRPTWSKAWVCAVLTAVLTLGTFLALRHELNAVAESTTLTPDERTYAANQQHVARRIDDAPARLPTAGVWFCNLLAEPATVGASFWQVRALALVLGWMLVGFFVAGLVPRVRRLSWLTAGAAVYTLAFVLLWGTPSPRYLVPVAPLLLLGIYDGIDRLGRVGTAPLWRGLRVLFLAGVFGGTVLCNASLYAVDACIIHSPDFYGHYMAGQTEPLIAIAEYLKAHGVRDGEVVRSYVSLKKVGVSPTVGRLLDIRGLSLLIDRVILLLPRTIPTDDDAQVAQWMAEHGGKYFVRRYPINPWRIWHFRVPGIQRLVTGRPVGAPTPYFTLHELKDGRLVQVPVPPWHGRITRVPGL